MRHAEGREMLAEEARALGGEDAHGSAGRERAGGGRLHSSR